MQHLSTVFCAEARKEFKNVEMFEIEYNSRSKQKPTKNKCFWLARASTFCCESILSYFTFNCFTKKRQKFPEYTRKIPKKTALQRRFWTSRLNRNRFFGLTLRNSSIYSFRTLCKNYYIHITKT